MSWIGGCALRSSWAVLGAWILPSLFLAVGSRYLWRCELCAELAQPCLCYGPLVVFCRAAVFDRDGSWVSWSHFVALFLAMKARAVSGRLCLSSSRSRSGRHGWL